nr:PREDICTED: organic cation transporter protein-like [Bemisia tabaci]XP_018897258.1 PREDICTED: organic cation transporter protein-like [Bemisia tabaci]
MTVNDGDEKLSIFGEQNPSHEFDKALESINRNKKVWLFTFFLLVSMPGILNSIHISVYVFFTGTPEHWCTIPQLENAGWTPAEIRNFTVPRDSKDILRSCGYYDWNYTEIAAMGYNAASAMIAPLPPVKQCLKRSFLDSEKGKSIESEWDLVCDRAVLKPSVQGIFAVGKFFGALFFGCVADKYGRKTSFFWASCVYLVAIPASSLTHSFAMFLLSRLAIGMAGSGAYESVFTILTETTTGNARTMMGTLTNVSYPIGMIILATVAYFNRYWRTLQLYLSAFMFLLIVDCWFVKESPKWLFAEGREEEAWAILKKIDDTIDVPKKRRDSRTSHKKKADHIPWYEHVLDLIKKFTSLFSEAELCVRILVCYFAWTVSALAYYLVALSGDNFAANKYLFIALNGVCEVPSYFLPIPLLRLYGRKATAMMLYFCSGMAQLSILFFNRSQVNWVTAVALFGRFTGSAVFGSLILQTTELFPTAQRNSAVGSSLMIAQVGSFVAPFLVASVGVERWYVPSVICGVLSLCCGILFCIIPETTGKPLYNTSKEIPPEDKVSFAQCCRFK